MRPAGQQKTRAFGRDLSCIEEVLSGVKNSLGTSPTSISGECREPKRTGTDWYFELADIHNSKVHVLPARIDARNAATIGRYLQGRGTSITQALQTGNLLELEATPTLDRRKKLILDVTKISLRFSRTGPIYVRDQRTMQQLAHAGVPLCRLDRDRIHAPIGGAMKLLPATLRRVLVIGSEKSQGLADFKESVDRAQQSGDLDVQYQSVTWSRDSAPTDLASILANCEADAISRYSYAAAVIGAICTSSTIHRLPLLSATVQFRLQRLLGIQPTFLWLTGQLTFPLRRQQQPERPSGGRWSGAQWHARDRQQRT